MSGRELDLAGITDPWLRTSFERCRRLNASHGRTYYLATLLLPAAKRPWVHALYGFARYADELVDSLDHPDPDRLLTWSQRFLADLDDGHSADPIAAAAVHTAHRWGIPRAYFEAFLASMRADITVVEYPTYADLGRYMYGSAAVIGLQMLPILEPVCPDAQAPARALGEAFQLSNVIRDVGEDLDRGRVYLPMEDLARFGLTRADLQARVTTPAVRALLAFEIDRARRLYAQARPGLAMVHPTSRACLQTAFELYGEILDAVERSGYRVLERRVSVPLSRRLAVAGPALLRARRARRRPQKTHQLRLCTTSANPNRRSSTGA
ncbi:MAG: phytoene/squalene synthase family protein [Actinomycetes bacterium]